MACAEQKQCFVFYQKLTAFCQSSTVMSKRPDKFLIICSNTSTFWQITLTHHSRQPIKYQQSTLCFNWAHIQLIISHLSRKKTDSRTGVVTVTVNRRRTWIMSKYTPPQRVSHCHANQRRHRLLHSTSQGPEPQTFKQQCLRTRFTGLWTPEALAGTEGIDTDQPWHRNTKKYQREHRNTSRLAAGGQKLWPEERWESDGHATLNVLWPSSQYRQPITAPLWLTANPGTIRLLWQVTAWTCERQWPPSKRLASVLELKHVPGPFNGFEGKAGETWEDAGGRGRVTAECVGGRGTKVQQEESMGISKFLFQLNK